jgi:hypothetical protein
MTGRNPNVFYEVGYAHALGKIVLLVTKEAEDIPFDLKHRQHIIYHGNIESLRKDLTSKLRWGIVEARKRVESQTSEEFSVRIEGTDIPMVGSTKGSPIVIGKASSRESFSVALYVRNDSLQVSAAITHVYLFASPDSAIVPCDYVTQSAFGSGGVMMTIVSPPRTVAVSLSAYAADREDAADGLPNQYRLKVAFPALPPSAVEAATLSFMFREPAREAEDTFRLRLHSPSRVHDYQFRMQITPPAVDMQEGTTE